MDEMREKCRTPAETLEIIVQSAEEIIFREKVRAVQGRTLREMISIQISAVKAVRAGDRLYDEKFLDVPLTGRNDAGYDSVTVYTSDCCMVSMAEREIEMLREKSCGKCTFCREGAFQISARLQEITEKKGEWSSLILIKEIAEAMSYSCRCPVGQFGAVMVTETLRMFENEYEDHIRKKRCTAGTCRAFKDIYIDPVRCSGCGMCITACGKQCIEGLPGYIHMIEEDDCTRCGECRKACKEDAIVMTMGEVPGLPDRLTRVGRFKRY